MAGLPRARGTARMWLIAAAVNAALASACWWPGVALFFGARPSAAVLLDVSASVVRPRPQWRVWRDEQLALEAARAVAADQEFLVAAFAEGFEVLFGPGRASAFDAARLPVSVLADADSELARALTVLAQRASSQRLERVVILGDGRCDGVDAREALDQLRRSGVEVEVRPPPPPELNDLWLESLRAPREAEAGAPLAVAARVRSLAGPLEPGARALLSFRVVDGRGERWFERVATPASFVGGEALVVCDLGPLDEGLTQIDARVRLAGGVDVVSENDECATTVRSRGARVIGVVGSGARRFEEWLSANRSSAGLQWLPVAETLDDVRLDACDALVTLDVDPRELDEARVRDFVRRGGGWFALGATVLANAKAAQSSGGLTELLPLQLEARRERDVLLLLDGSGSMDPLASAELRAASLELALRAPAGQRVVLWWFTDRLQDSFELRPGFDAAARERNVASWTAARAPGGPTDIVAVLSELARRRAGGGAALAFLISDGRDQRQRGASAQELERVVSALAAAEVRLVVAAAGASSDRAWLDELARSTARGSAWSAADASLAEALASEAAREHLDPLGGAVSISASSGDDDADVTALRASWGALGALPQAGEFLRTRARAGDAVVLEVAGGEPLIALRRTGEGWCAFWTSDPVRTGSAAWVRAPGLIAPLLRTLVRAARSAPREELRARVDARGRWRLEGLPAGVAARVWLADVVRPSERVSADIPADSNALDPRGVRVALEPHAPRARVLVVSNEAGDELARVASEPTAPPEFTSSWHELAAGVHPPLGRTVAGTGASTGHRGTLGLLAALLALLALGASLACSNWASPLRVRQVLPGARR